MIFYGCFLPVWESLIFQIYKAVGALEVEVDFLRVKEVKNGNVVLAEAQMLEGFTQFLGVYEKVREDDHKRSLLDFFGNLVESRDKAGVARGFEILE